jgi:hypothetical protein
MIERRLLNRHNPACRHRGFFYPMALLAGKFQSEICLEIDGVRSNPRLFDDHSKWPYPKRGDEFPVAIIVSGPDETEAVGCFTDYFVNSRWADPWSGNEYVKKLVADYLASTPDLRSETDGFRRWLGIETVDEKDESERDTEKTVRSDNP